MSNILDDHIEETFQYKLDSVELIRRNMADDYKRLMMFRIKSLTILHHYVLGNIKLDLWQDNGKAPIDIYSTVMIGANGIGKSYLLRAIADIFCYLEARKAEGELKILPRFKFQIQYIYHGNLYEFANFGKIEPVGKFQEVYSHYCCKKNGKTISIADMELPTKVIASTMTVTDKFNAKGTERYKYKGIRNENSPSTTGTRTMIRKTVSGLMYTLEAKEGVNKEVKDLLIALGLEPRMEVTYTIRYKDVFVKEDMTANKLIEIFTNQKEYFKNRKTEVWGTSNFERIRHIPGQLEIAAEFLNKAAKSYEILNSKRYVVNYHVLEDNEIVRDREAIDILSSLDILSFPSLMVYKKDNGYEFSESSSGETHMLCQMLGIMSDIEHGSLVMIDEPENSSHPNWQINYIEWLKNIFNHYCDSHFVIATHSHFILTDLKPESSDIIALEKTDDGIVHDIAEGLNTFCWSVDDILYRVFHVRNTRNRVFEEKVADLYDRISRRDKDKEGIYSLIWELTQYQLSEDDPLSRLIQTAKEYVESE